MSVLFRLGGAFSVPMELPCVVLWRPEALDCRVLYPSRGFGVGLPVTRPAWDSNLGPPASEVGSLTTALVTSQFPWDSFLSL